MTKLKKYEDTELVSIIMPAHNSEKSILESINSVITQSYQNWELIIIDDKSSDTTVVLIEELMEQEKRILLIKLSENLGAAKARNKGIMEAKGKYLAFLDSDDLWEEDKLTKQIKFMEENNYTFTSTSYKELNMKQPADLNIVEAHKALDYNGVLKNCPGNSTVIYDVSKLGKFYSPDIRKRNDFAMWLQVIKKAKILYGIKEPLTTYRIHEGSLSSNKVDLVKYQWNVYRNIENLSLVKSFYLLLHKTLSVLSKNMH